jgi:signal transduction histidine kinase
VRATLEDGWVEVTVRDHGPGIVPAERDAVFTPFFTGGTALPSDTRHAYAIDDLRRR